MYTILFSKFLWSYNNYYDISIIIHTSTQTPSSKIEAAQTPLLITLLAPTATQINSTEELKASAKQAQSCKPDKSQTLTTTTITDIKTLPIYSVQTSSLTQLTAMQTAPLKILTTRRRSQAWSKALAHLICITLMDIFIYVEVTAKSDGHSIQEYQTKLHEVDCNPFIFPNGTSALVNSLYYTLRTWCFT